ncbi:MAG: histidine phosphatase family protein [Pirellulaceae bacterium]
MSKKQILNADNLILISTPSTELDLQGRFSGRLDVPLAEQGLAQAQSTAIELANSGIQVIFRAPTMAAKQAAALFSREWRAKVRVERDLENIDYGLWHGKTLGELKRTQPRVYTSWLHHPESICPPSGEPISAVMNRIDEALDRILKNRAVSRRHCRVVNLDRVDGGPTGTRTLVRFLGRPKTGWRLDRCAKISNSAGEAEIAYSGCGWRTIGRPPFDFPLTEPLIRGQIAFTGLVFRVKSFVLLKPPFRLSDVAHFPASFHYNR